jgi:hypothetical protein
METTSTVEIFQLGPLYLRLDRRRPVAQCTQSVDETMALGLLKNLPISGIALSLRNFHV